MKLINFKYWLQGWLEIENPDKVSKKQIEEIKNHLNIIDEKDYFIGWLTGFLEGKKKIDKNDIILLKEELQKQFLKVTDSQSLDTLLGKELPIFDKRFPKVPQPKYLIDKLSDLPDISKAIIC